MRSSDLIGIVGALLALGAFLYSRIAMEMPLPVHVVLYVGLVGALYWLYFNLEELFTSLRRRAVQQTGLAIVVVVLGFAVFVGANFIAERHPQRYDATDVGLYTLAPQTLKVVEGLDRPLRVMGFFSEGMEGKDKFQDLIDGYRLHSEKITVQWIDPEYEPALTKQYGIRSAGTVVLEMEGQTQQLTNPDEEELTNAIIGLTRTERKKVYFLQGHGEKSISEAGQSAAVKAAEELRKKGFDVDGLSLFAQAGGAVPPDARVIVIAGPRQDLLQGEGGVLTGWMNQGGRIVLLADPETPASFTDLATARGINLPTALVVDQVGQTYVGDATVPVVSPSSDHKITKDMVDGVILMAYTRPLVAGTAPEGTTVESLVASTENAWGETDLSAFNVTDPAAMGTPKVLQYDEGADVPGPVTTAMVASWSVDGASAPVEEDGGKERQGVLVVMGDADFMSDVLFEQQLNGDLFLNTVSFLAKEDDLLSIRPRKREAAPFTPTESQGALIAYSSLLIMPGLCLLGALMMFMRRRRL